MRAILVMVLLVTLSATSVPAVPVNPTDPQGIAAIAQRDPANSPLDLLVLTTTGQVWYGNGTSWSRGGAGFLEGEADLPVPVSTVVDWWLWGFRTNSGEWWLHNTNHWYQVPPPPFAPTPAARQTLGDAKHSYR